jgi:RNA polymerase sigma factor (sigma-70 family)
MMEPTDVDLLAQEFELHRGQLQAVAYRMLGSVGEAEDAVQEAWLRLTRKSNRPIDNLGAWLTTVVGRVSLDMLRARRTRREDYLGSWLPEPIVQLDDERHGPEHEAVLADSMGLALLVVLETLTPAERLAFVLHDMFAVPFDDIATMLDRTPDAARQLASRARRRVRGAAPTTDADLDTQRTVVSAFLSAARNGDFDALVAVLDPDVVFRVDARGRAAAPPPVVRGVEDVGRYVATVGPHFAKGCYPARVNGGAGVVTLSPSGVVLAVSGMTIVRGRIAEIDLILDRDKLAGLDITR